MHLTFFWSFSDLFWKFSEIFRENSKPTNKKSHIPTKDPLFPLCKAYLYTQNNKSQNYNGIVIYWKKNGKKNPKYKKLKGKTNLWFPEIWREKPTKNTFINSFWQTANLTVITTQMKRLIQQYGDRDGLARSFCICKIFRTVVNFFWWGGKFCKCIYQKRRNFLSFL